ncbi:MAG: CapA family protein, partial [Atopobiaceae bacterium]|nr:CapA family protein [Atopobiaceae bacterium]
MADERDARRKLQPTRRSDSGRARQASSTPRASRAETTRETSDAVRARIEARRAARQGAQASQERPSQARRVTFPSRTRTERPQGIDGGRRRAEKAGPSPAERLGGLASGAGDTLARIRDNLKPIYLLLVLGVLALLLLVTLISRCARGAGSATPTTPVAPAEPQHVSVMMVGDILVHQGVWESGQQADGSYNYDHLFAHIADDLAEADIAMLDQET